ncbi:MAG: sigma-54-dependent Fis family transcriptional regulator [Deltaproteobacteria bacterium]|nr:sigma-54-dependent Fis family transcriptional regulator [Deltaproteobacteria bacterium]
MPDKEMKLLIVEDEKAQREMLEGFLLNQGFPVLSVDEGRAAVEAVRREPVDLVFLDFKMPGMDGLETLRELRRINPELAVVMMTAYGTIETAVESMKAGAADYLTKPIDLDELLLLIEKVSEKILLKRENRELKERLRQGYRFDQIIYASGKMEEVLSLTVRVADSQATVLIRGESGTGKELIANAIHYASPRADRRFVKVNCTALPDNLLESELFGHERGAFTGAFRRRIGRFEEAHGGSIFLDEVGDLSPTLQMKLLRVLQERRFERLGSNQTIETDVRIIAATNRDLEEALREKRFREDLYYRLNVVVINLPPLRERREDIPRLIDHFLIKYSKKNRRTLPRVTKEARDRLLQYDYPGNVRELENVIERSIVVSRGDFITVRDLPFQVRDDARQEGPDHGVGAEGGSLHAVLSRVERDLIVKALEEHGGVQTRAARSLGINERVLRYKMQKYGLSAK